MHSIFILQKLQTEGSDLMAPDVLMPVQTTLVRFVVGLFNNKSNKQKWSLSTFYTAALIRPPDIVVGGLIFYQGFFFLSFFAL